jgi:hypothetical protein
MTSTLATQQVAIGDYVLSVTTRDAGDDPALLEELTFRTIGAFLYIAALLEKGVYSAGVNGSVEQRLAAEKEIEFKETFVDPRVTVWDTFRGSKTINFHLNSDDEPQVAMNTWLANNNAIARAVEKYGIKTAPNAVSSASVPQTAPTTSAAPQTAQNGVVRVIGWKSAKELTPGTMFNSPIAKIEAAMDKKGVLTWELFCPYGGSPGKFKDFTVFSDNEHTAALSQRLMEWCGKAGTSITGSWTASGNVTESKGKKYVNVWDLVQA